MPTLPTLVTLVRLDDVWIGRPALPAVLRAADYRVPLPMNASVEALHAAVKHLLAAPTLERPRARGQSTIRVDVRPLIDTVLVDVGGMALRIRTRFLPDRGAGRPEDVLGAVDDSLAEPLPWGETERERLILAE